MGLASFTIDVDELGHGHIELNGQEVAEQVAELQVRTRPGEPTIVVVRQVVGATQIDGEGIVHVQAEGLDEASTVREFLDNLDPNALEQLVLAQFASIDPPATNGEAWIRALQQLVER